MKETRNTFKTENLRDNFVVTGGGGCLPDWNCCLSFFRLFFILFSVLAGVVVHSLLVRDFSRDFGLVRILCSRPLGGDF